MRIQRHPALTIGGRDDPSGGPRLELAHARLWLRLRLPDGSGSRDWHLHLVRSPRVESEEGWSEVDLSRRPLRAVGEAGAFSDERWHRLAADLERHLAATPVVLFLEPGTGLVSEPGESRAEFRRRLAGLLRPALLDRVRGGAGGGPADARAGASAAAAELAAVLDGVVSTEGVTLLEAAISGELGPLSVRGASDVLSRDRRDRMLGHGRPMPGGEWGEDG